MYLCCICLMLCSSVARARNVFNSYQSMEGLYVMEGSLLDSLQAAINHHRIILDILIQRHTEISSQRPAPAEGSAALYLRHPVHAFTLVRRLAKDWPFILTIMSQHYEPPSNLIKVEKGEAKKDVQSALRGLTRIQQVYDLKTDQLADGWVEDAQAVSVLTAADCMEIAHYLLESHELALAANWVRTASRRVLQEDDSVSPELVTSYLYLANTLGKCESNQHSQPSEPVLMSLLNQRPLFTPDMASAELYRLALAGNCSWYNGTINLEKQEMTPEEHQRYNEMCRAGSKYGPGVLKCHYVHYHNPALRIAPFKLEEVNIDPPLVLVHQMISDHEIEKLQEVFYIWMSDCDVTVGENQEPSTFRTCSRSWVYDHDTPAAERLTHRIGHLADLSMVTSEASQVACYGLGGEFKLHYDWHPLVKTKRSLRIGQRLATTLIYLNDVERGGHTVFPKMNVTIAPVKGSALLWFNMLYDGAQDDRTEHGGCPVVLGQKWVINRLIHEVGQDSRHCPSDKIYPKPYFYL